MPLILEMAPYNLTIVLNRASGIPENELIEVDDRQLMTTRRGAKSIQRSERPVGSLQSVLADMRAQGVKVAVPRSRLERATLRLWKADTKLATTDKDSSEVGDCCRDQFWVKPLFYPWVLPDETKSPPKKASPNTSGESAEPKQVGKENVPSKTGDQSRLSPAAAPKKQEGFGVHRKPSQAPSSDN